VEILLWLVPPVVVTVIAMLWVGWLGREGRGVVDRETAVRRMGDALGRQPRSQVVVRQAPRERSTGVAVRAPRAATRSTGDRAS
jgi:cytochrome c-type biogenesis protein CcmH/NrfF